MIIGLKHRVMLWTPTLLFVFLVLGDVSRGKEGEWIYRIYSNGFVVSVLILSAALLISRAERGSFIVGVILWVLSLGALFLIDRSVLAILHF